MREFFNAILEAIGAESLTDEEFLTCDSVTPIYDQGTYDDLAAVIGEREAVSTLQQRLIWYYQARGVEVEAYSTAQTNIFLGAALE